MDGQMGRLGRVSKAASVVVWVVLAVFGCSAVLSALNWALNQGSFSENTVLVGISSLMGQAGVMLVLGLVLGLLKNLCGGKSPFCTENIRLFKKISAAMWVVAGVLFLTDLLVAFTISTSIVPSPGGGAVTVGVQQVAFQYTSFLLLVVGLVVWCVGLAFQHGAALQQQSDETL